jgi:hypothetical protein
MSKKILVREASFIDFVKSFFKAKSQGREDKAIETIKKYDKNLGDAWEKWNNSADDLLITVKRYYEKIGDTKKAAEIQNTIDKKYT